MQKHSTHQEFMQVAFDEAFDGMHHHHGGPFGAVIVQNGTVIGRGHNRVTSSNDPTAHAEIIAIRQACERVKHFHLKDAVIYSTCEPCPMCLAAIYWAHIDTVYYSLDRHDAEKIGFSDRFIYDELASQNADKKLNINILTVPAAQDLFNEWSANSDKTDY